MYYNEAIQDLYDRLQSDGTFDKYYSCTKKTVYETMKLATVAAYRQDEISQSSNPNIKVKKGIFYVPYKCRYCYGYHVGRASSLKNTNK